MPSKTFFHLPAEKRERLLLAAEEEFARVPYAEASINRMIRAAGIPRGSFYMYFRDKEELFHYLLKRYQDGLLQRLERVLEERNHHVGDFRHIVEISDLFVIKELVKADCGITFLYRKAVEKELAEGSLCQVALTDFQISHEFTFLWRKNSAFETELRETSRALWTL